MLFWLPKPQQFTNPGLVPNSPSAFHRKLFRIFLFNAIQGKDY